MVWYLSTVLKRITTLCRCQTNLGYCHTLVHITYFRILANITYKHYLVHAF